MFPDDLVLSAIPRYLRFPPLSSSNMSDRDVSMYVPTFQVTCPYLFGAGLPLPMPLEPQPQLIGLETQ